MDAYPHFWKLLEKWAHIGNRVPKYDSHIWREADFSLEWMIGLIVHSFIGVVRHRNNYYTDGEKIYFPDGDEPLYIFTEQNKEDVLKEDLVLQILDACPPESKDLYGMNDLHYVLHDFTYCFKGYGIRTAYHEFIDKTAADIPAQIIRELAGKDINRRILRNRDHLTALLEALQQDPEPLPGYAATLEKSLREFGF